VKKIKDDKNFLDQSLMEIYVLNYLNEMGRHNEHNFLAMVEYFYLNVA